MYRCHVHVLCKSQYKEIISMSVLSSALESIILKNLSGASLQIQFSSSLPTYSSEDSAKTPGKILGNSWQPPAISLQNLSGHPVVDVSGHPVVECKTRMHTLYS